MRAGGLGRDHGMVTVASPTAPRVFRRPDHGIAGGVATGIAEHIGVRPAVIRFCFVVLAAAGGLGVALYGAYWIVLPTPPNTRGRLPFWLEYMLGGIAAAVAIAVVASSLPAGGLFVPTT